MGLGGGTPQRRLVAAGHHLSAGDPGRARVLLEENTDTLAPGPQRAEALSLLATVHLVSGSFPEAADVLRRALGESGDDLALRVRILVALSSAVSTPVRWLPQKASSRMRRHTLSGLGRVI